MPARRQASRSLLKALAVSAPIWGCAQGQRADGPDRGDAVHVRHVHVSGVARIVRDITGPKQACAQKALAALYMDLNGFNAGNGTHGHDAGDEVLRT